jgi:hypothetical protein
MGVLFPDGRSWRSFKKHNASATPLFRYSWNSGCGKTRSAHSKPPGVAAIRQTQLWSMPKP